MICFGVYAASTFSIMHPICRQKFCISIVSSFSWDGCNTQEKWKTKSWKILGANKVRYGIYRSVVFPQASQPSMNFNISELACSKLVHPPPRGICRAFVIFSWNGCKFPTVGPGGSYKTPTGGAEKKVNFFSAKFSITVKYWKKGTTLTASRRIDKCPTPGREDVFWQISLRRDRQGARQMPGWKGLGGGHA